MLAHCHRNRGTSMGQCVTHLQYKMSVTLDEEYVDSGETVVDRQHKAKARHVVAL